MKATFKKTLGSGKESQTYIVLFSQIKTKAKTRNKTKVRQQQYNRKINPVNFLEWRLHYSNLNVLLDIVTFSIILPLVCSYFLLLFNIYPQFSPKEVQVSFYISILLEIVI